MINELKVQMNWIIIQVWIFFIPIVMAFQTNHNQEENQAPNVQILTPINNSRFQWGTEIQYTIHISDKEDGNSDYDEINHGEVVMQITYLADSTTLNQFSKASQTEPNAITIMKSSTCFSCHASRNKLIGPSFDRIAARYKADETTIDRLTLKVMQGSHGTWGEVQMPSNTDLKPGEIKQVVRWIIENNRASNVFYQVGLKGSFRIKEKTAGDSEESMYVLTCHTGPNQEPKHLHHILFRCAKHLY